MKRLLSLLVLFLLVFLSGCDDNPDLLISSYSKTKDTITIEFSGNVSFTPPRTLRAGSNQYDVDIYRDDGTVSLFRLGHYGLLNTTKNSITLAILGDWGVLSDDEYNVKVYTGDFMTPNVLVETENFSFASWNKTSSNSKVIINDPEEVYVTVGSDEGGGIDTWPPLEGLAKADFTLFQDDGTQVDFNFKPGKEVDPGMLPAHEYQLTPISGVFSGSYYVRFVDSGHNPSNERFTIGE